MSKPTPLASRSSRTVYAYDTFTTDLIVGDLAFRRTDPGPGDPVPAFDLEVLGGGRVTKATLGQRPPLIVFGSMT